MKSTTTILALLLIFLSSQPFAAENPSMQNLTSPQSSEATKNAMASEDFLAANKKKPGVISTSSGLQYKVITQGTGAKPMATDVVTVDYVGKLINGAEFDSSYKRGQPATFELGGVIPGWVEGLQLMRKGATYEFYIPAKLAYGERGAPPVIGPNQALIFQVKLIDFKKM